MQRNSDDEPQRKLWQCGRSSKRRGIATKVITAGLVGDGFPRESDRLRATLKGGRSEG